MYKTPRFRYAAELRGFSLYKVVFYRFIYSVLETAGSPRGDSLVPGENPLVSEGNPLVLGDNPLVPGPNPLIPPHANTSLFNLQSIKNPPAFHRKKA